MRSLHILLLAASLTLAGCALQPSRPATPLSQCSFGETGWKTADRVDPAAIAAVRLYGPPPAGYKELWLQNTRGDYRYCVLRPGSHDRCGNGKRVLHLWKQDGRWISTGWFDASECRRARAGRSN
jgi:hypothetical protein